jgi:hypothetical protein
LSCNNKALPGLVGCLDQNFKEANLVGLVFMWFLATYLQLKV